MSLPAIIRRYPGEETDSDTTLGWDNTISYKYMRFNPSNPSNTLITYHNNDKELPDKLKQVIETFISHIDKFTWDIFNLTWHSTTPALQFCNKNYIEDIKLSDRNVYTNYNGIYGYFINVCESNMKQSIEESLEPQTVDWWEQRYGTYIKYKQLVNFSKKKKRILIQDIYVTFIVYESTDGYTYTTLPTANIDETNIIGEKTAVVKLLYTDEILDYDLDDVRYLSTGKIIKDGIEYLSQFMKIRLQVKPEYQIYTTMELIKLLTATNTLPYVDTFKCSIVYNKITTNRLASIVIYVIPNKSNAYKLLNTIIAHFFQYKDVISLDHIPRYNIRLNQLVYYSFGDGDLKVKLEKLGLIKKYFDDQTYLPYAKFKNT
jgi:hypothetical protein